MSWLSKEPTRVQSVSQKKSIPEGIWEKCEKCGEISLASEFLESHRVCSHCGFHARLPALERLELLLDAGTFLEWDSQLKSCDPLEFNDGRSYASRLNTQFQKTQRLDAFISGTGKLGDHTVALGVLDFFWMGGSMGTVVGKKSIDCLSGLSIINFLSSFVPPVGELACMRVFCLSCRWPKPAPLWQSKETQDCLSFPFYVTPPQEGWLQVMPCWAILTLQSQAPPLDLRVEEWLKTPFARNCQRIFKPPNFSCPMEC